MPQYKVAFFLPVPPETMVVAEVLDFPGVFSQGVDLQDARRMVASALDDMAQLCLEEGASLPIPNPGVAVPPDADIVEEVQLSIPARGSVLSGR